MRSNRMPLRLIAYLIGNTGNSCSLPLPGRAPKQPDSAAALRHIVTTPCSFSSLAGGPVAGRSVRFYLR